MITLSFRIKPKKVAPSLMKICLALALVAALAGCATDSPVSPSSASAGDSPVIVAPANSSATPVTLSGYVDTSVTTQSK
jgi:hypothetical protein